MCVLCISFYNKIPQLPPRWLINNRNVFLTVLEPGKSKIKAPTDVISGENSFWFIGHCLLSEPSHGEELSEVSFTRAPITFITELPNHAPKSSLSNTITLEIRFDMCVWARGRSV